MWPIIKDKKKKKETGRFVVNKRTGQKIKLPTPIDEGIRFEEGRMITETDPEGYITYANRKFVLMSGYTKGELIGAPHSIVRHPDMPKGLFYGLWKTIQEGKIWRGYMKILRKDGRYIWALSFIEPKYDEHGKITGYISVKKMATEEEIQEVEKKYKELSGERHMKDPYFLTQFIAEGE